MLFRHFVELALEAAEEICMQIVAFRRMDRIANFISRTKVAPELHRLVAKIESCLRHVVHNCELKSSKSPNKILRETADHFSELRIFRNFVMKTRLGLRGNFLTLALVLDVIAVLQFLAGLGPQQLLGVSPRLRRVARGIIPSSCS